MAMRAGYVRAGRRRASGCERRADDPAGTPPGGDADDVNVDGPLLEGGRRRVEADASDGDRGRDTSRTTPGVGLPRRGPMQRGPTRLCMAG